MPNIDARVRASLDRLRRGAPRLTAVEIRRNFARSVDPVPDDAISDRNLPLRELRPPATRLLVRGAALRTYLTLLFHQHTRASRGRSAALPPVRADGSELSLIDLVALVASHDPASEVTVTTTDNRARQMRQALDTLSGDDVRLLELPRRNASSRRYEGAQMLHESGILARMDKVRYTVPRVSESRISIPVEFFLQGWIHALSDAELCAYLMLRDKSNDREPIEITGRERLRWYGVSRDAYMSLNVLAQAGILEVEPARGRRSDGTYEDFNSDSPPPVHRWHLNDEGLDQLAVDAMLRAVRRQISESAG